MSNSGKIWCDVWDGVVLKNRCLIHLGMMAEEKKTCSDCICFEKMQLEQKLDQIRFGKRKKKK